MHFFTWDYVFFNDHMFILNGYSGLMLVTAIDLAQNIRLGYYQPSFTSGSWIITCGILPLHTNPLALHRRRMLSSTSFLLITPGCSPPPHTASVFHTGLTPHSYSHSHWVSFAFFFFFFNQNVPVALTFHGMLLHHLTQVWMSLSNPSLYCKLSSDCSSSLVLIPNQNSSNSQLKGYKCVWSLPNINAAWSYKNIYYF